MTQNHEIVLIVDVLIVLMDVAEWETPSKV